jgi:hypothetical protein
VTLSRRFTARRRCHGDFPTSVHTLSLPSPLYHYLPPQLITRPTTVTSTRRRCLCLCLCLLSTSLCQSPSVCTIHSTSLTRHTPLPLDQSLKGTTISRPVVVVKLVLLIFKTPISISCLHLYVCLDWLGSEPNVLRCSLCSVRNGSPCRNMSRSCAMFIKPRQKKGY